MAWRAVSDTQWKLIVAQLPTRKQPLRGSAPP